MKFSIHGGSWADLALTIIGDVITVVLTSLCCYFAWRLIAVELFGAPWMNLLTWVGLLMTLRLVVQFLFPEPKGCDECN
jgi:hypothetical protein